MEEKEKGKQKLRKGKGNEILKKNIRKKYLKKKLKERKERIFPNSDGQDGFEPLTYSYQG